MLCKQASPVQIGWLFTYWFPNCKRKLGSVKPFPAEILQSSEILEDMEGTV